MFTLLKAFVPPKILIESDAVLVNLTFPLKVDCALILRSLLKVTGPSN